LRDCWFGRQPEHKGGFSRLATVLAEDMPKARLPWMPHVTLPPLRPVLPVVPDLAGCQMLVIMRTFVQTQQISEATDESYQFS
jgi:hypothetical protein